MEFLFNENFGQLNLQAPKIVYDLHAVRFYKEWFYLVNSLYKTVLLYRIHYIRPFFIGPYLVYLIVKYTCELQCNGASLFRTMSEMARGRLAGCKIAVIAVTQTCSYV